MSSSCGSIEDFSLDQLKFSSQCFKENNVCRGFNSFDGCLPSHKNKVYEQIWINRGKPEGDLKYGEHVFRGKDEQYSCSLEKVHAIDAFLSSNKNSNSAASISGRSWTYTSDGSEYVPHRRGEIPRPPIKNSKVWCPTTGDECLQVGGALAVLGAVSAGAYAAYQALQALKGAMT